MKVLEGKRVLAELRSRTATDTCLYLDLRKLSSFPKVPLPSLSFLPPLTDIYVFEL